MDIVAKISVFVACCIVGIRGHGRMLEPPQRSSIWRFNNSFPANYNDNELFCGGVGVQWGQNGGKCGTCGDPFNGARENEAGGKYATGYIVRTYRAGQAIEIGIDLTAAHQGYFQFRLCPHNNPDVPVQQGCLDNHVLATTNGSLRYHPGFDTGWHNLSLVLPKDITCSQCVLQWHYIAGNTWGCFPNKTCCQGCGAQETFINCADIAILGGDGQVTSTPSPQGTPTPATTTAAPATPSAASTKAPSVTNTPGPATTTTAAPATPSAASTKAPSVTNTPGPASTKAPSVTNTPGPATTTSAAPATPSAASTKSPSVTSAPGPATTASPAKPPSPVLDIQCPQGSIVSCDGETEFVVDFCNAHCGQRSPACTTDMCTCACKTYSCKAIGPHAGLPGMDQWCENECVKGCPSLINECECKYN